MTPAATLLPAAAVPPINAVLVARGWGADRAREAAFGMAPVAVLCEYLEGAGLEALVRTAGRLGLEVVTGDDWALLVGARSRLAVFARPWTLPGELAGVAAALAAALPEAPPTTDD